MLVSVGAETSDYSNLGYTVSKSSLNSHRNKVYAHSRMYTDVLSFTISIVKKNLSKFTQTEKRTISRWLTSPRTQREFIITDCTGDDTHSNVVYKCICNGETEVRPSPRQLYGLSFTFECNAPYGFTGTKEQAFESQSQATVTINVDTDDLEDRIYPRIVIMPGATGEITIENTSQNPGKVFSVTGHRDDQLTIDTSLGIIYDYADTFKYDSETNLIWPILKHGENTISITGNCTGRILWEEPRKVGI